MVKLKLSGSSLLESVVASLIFLFVFVVSLSTLTGLTLRPDEGYVLLEAENALADCFRHYGNGNLNEGTYTDIFEWGEITTSITEYRNYGNIQQITMKARITGNRKVIESIRLVVK